MTDRKLDRLCESYLMALDQSDYDALEELWEQAGLNPDLEAAFHELNAELNRLDAAEGLAQDTTAITEAVQKYLPKAKLDESTGPVTLADVAAELFRNPPPAWPSVLHAFNESLRTRTDEVPDTKSLTALLTWAATQPGNASEVYWRAFRDRAMLLTAARDPEIGLAARTAKPKGSS
ncbi:hypothetical protein BH11PLA2_BH11PLA2_50930 [soil metagenome]